MLKQMWFRELAFVFCSVFFFFFPACTLFSRWHTHKLKCKIRKYSLATRKKGGNESNTKQNKTKQNDEHKDTIPSVFADTSLKPSAAKWNVTAGGSGSSRDPLSTLTRWWTHMRYLCLNARISPGFEHRIALFLFLFNLRRGSWERKKKPSAGLNITQRVDHCSQGVFVQVKWNPCVLVFLSPPVSPAADCCCCCCCTRDTHRAGLLRTVRSGPARRGPNL